MTDAFLSSPAFKLHQATILIDRVADAYLEREHGIRYAPFLVLLMVRLLGPTSQQAIAAQLGVTRASITQRVGAFADQGYLDVARSTIDSRAHVVALTPRGSALVDRAWAGLEEHQDGIDDGVDAAALSAALDRLITNAQAVLQR